MKYFILAMSLFACASAFMEDICVLPGGTGYKNLYQAAFNIGCKTGNTSQACAALTVATALNPSSCCIGSIHMLSSYALGQAVGLDPEIAYFLALYSSATDPAVLTVCNACGNAMPQRYQAPSMKGTQRMGINSGGYISHMPAHWMGHVGNGLDPDVFDHETEGFIASYRDWVYSRDRSETHSVPTGIHNNHHDACVFGLTVPYHNNPFSGAVCPDEGYINSTFPLFPSGTVSMTAAEVTAIWGKNNALLKTVKYITNAINYMSETPLDQQGLTLNDIAEWLANNGNYSILDNGEQVPVGIVKFGVYIHFLADRVSHYYCTDEADSNMNLVQNEPDVYQTTFSFSKCNMATHSLNHFWEIGQTNGNAPQTAAAISKITEEFQYWATEMETRYPNWFITFHHHHYRHLEDIKAGLNTLVTIQNAGQRLAYYLNLLQQWGFASLPQFPNYSTTCSA